MRGVVMVLFAAIVLCGCHNEGDSGMWSGTWYLERITVDGSVEMSYKGNMFWKFQADVIDMVETDDEMHEHQDHYGTWSASDDDRVLTLDFSHSSDRYPAGSPEYSPPAVTGLAAGVSHLDVARLTGSDMVVKWTDDESGTERTFVLKKQ